MCTFAAMFLYNITVGVDKDIEHEWLRWMKAEYIPKVMRTQLFVDYKLYKVLHDENEESVSYCVQYFANTLNDVTSYFEKYPALIDEHRTRYHNKHVAFMTLLEQV
ncbi:DUF4286 family protein [Chryseolinea sp. T2]|uniref:DUF4286 family protein n=1 Tax=Chryseolinea sp. T2 TaxID=3129255 RepID=UPI003077CDA3